MIKDPRTINRRIKDKENKRNITTGDETAYCRLLTKKEEESLVKYLISPGGLSSDERSALIGFHNWTGNYYIGSFFRKAKKTCWKVAKKKPEFMSFFSSLGLSLEISDNLIAAAEAYVCALYGKMKLRSVNEARIKIFWEKYNKNKKIVELSMLPPCRENLILHLKRANYTSFLMRSTTIKPNIDHFTEHGWTADGGSIWSQEYLPNEIQQILYDDAVVQIKKDEGENEVDDLLDTEDDNDDIEEEDEDDDDIEMVDFS